MICIDNLHTLYRIHFSYTNTESNAVRDIIQDRWDLRDAAYKSTYMRKCGLCDEFLYLPIKVGGASGIIPYFKIVYNESVNEKTKRTYSWLYNVPDLTVLFAFLFSLHII